jgi:hypothetical protein
MPYAAQYAQFVEAEIPVSKTLLRPRNIYKLKSYTDVHGVVHNYNGSKAAYIFVIGIANQKVYALKISDLRPPIFWRWMKAIIKPGVIIDDKIKRLEDVLLKDTKPGVKLFENFIKSRSIYNIEPSAYRTYDIKGISSIVEAKIDLNYLKIQYNLKSEKANSEYDDPKVDSKKTVKVRNQEQKVKESQPNKASDKKDSPLGETPIK